MSTAPEPVTVAGLRSALLRVAPAAVIVALWTLLAVSFTGLRVVPTPWAVIHAFLDDLPVYGPNVSSTLSVAGVGFLVGNGAALALGVVFVQVPWVERLLLRIAVASFCVPLVAIAPILVVVLPGDAPKQTLAALSVFFTTLIAVVLGLRSADPASLQVVRSLGGSQWQAMFKIRFFAMLPSLFGALRIAAPAALLGAIIGEYLGASQGLGVMLVQAQSSFQVPRTWAVALVMSALAGLAYLVFGVIGRLMTPWAAHDVTLVTVSQPPPPPRRMWAAVTIPVLGVAGSIAIVIACWYALIAAFDLNAYFAKTPLDVLRFITSSPEASENRTSLWSGLKITLTDAGAGYAFGTLAASLTALLIVTSKTFERAVMPVAIALRSVPLVAMTPLLALVFGRGLTGVTVIVSIVTFFPTLINVVVGLRSAPALATDVVRSLGGSNALATRKVRILYALPAFFASARTAVPGALAGATLAEWLATGQGIGSMIVQDYAGSRFDALWTESVMIVVVSVLFYTAISALERPITRRFAVGGA
jgi:ABC-type nitrate/sulfonate/bicarbonate transport system permease component